jgi:hypothetical protein
MAHYISGNGARNLVGTKNQATGKNLTWIKSMQMLIWYKGSERSMVLMVKYRHKQI